MKNPGLDAGLGASVSTYTNLNGLQRINQLADKDQNLALKEMAKQFESIFLDLMLKTMREANSVFSEGGMFDSSEMDFHQQMFDQQLALTLSSGRGIGLADVFYRQMQQNTQARVESIESSLPSSTESDMKEILPRAARPNDFAERAQAAALSAQQFVAHSPNQVAPNAEKPSLDLDGSQEEFVHTLRPFAERAAQSLGVDPSVLLAQAALETGWGKYVARDDRGASSFNLFNIKADQRWEGSSVRVSTVEFRDGIAEREVASFRRYNTIGESFDDYVRFVKSQGRYEDALAAEDAENFVRELHRAGYATDPEYANKVLRLMQTDVIKSADANASQPREPRG